MSVVVESEEMAAALLEEGGTFQQAEDEGRVAPDVAATEVIARVRPVVEYYLAAGNTGPLYATFVEPMMQWAQYAFMGKALTLGMDSPAGQPYTSAVNTVREFFDAYSYLKDEA